MTILNYSAPAGNAANFNFGVDAWAGNPYSSVIPLGNAANFNFISQEVLEAGTALDSASAQVPILVSRAETLTAATAQSNTITFNRAMTEALSVVDSDRDNNPYVRVNESGALTATQAFAFGFRDVETMTAADHATILYLSNPIVAELITISDSPDPVGLIIQNRTVSESMSAADHETRTTRNIVETMSAADTVSTDFGLGVIVRENTNNVQEEASAVRIVHVTVAEILTVSDRPAICIPRSVSESMSAADGSQIGNALGNRSRLGPPYTLWPLGQGHVGSNH